MSVDTGDSVSTTDPTTPRNVRSTIWFIVLVGVVGNGLWALVFGPGLGALGRVLLTALTFGSDGMRNWAYKNAALDPTPLPSLLLLIALSLVPILKLQWEVMEIFGDRTDARFRARRQRELAVEAKRHPNKSDHERHLAVARRGIRRSRLALVVLYALVSLMALGATLVVNQSILIWRA